MDPSHPADSGRSKVHCDMRCPQYRDSKRSGFCAQPATTTVTTGLVTKPGLELATRVRDDTVLPGSNGPTFI